MSDLNPRRFCYHPTEAPTGRLFDSVAAWQDALANGWYDNPGEFPVVEADPPVVDLADMEGLTAADPDPADVPKKRGRPRKADV